MVTTASIGLIGLLQVFKWWIVSRRKPRCLQHACSTMALSRDSASNPRLGKRSISGMVVCSPIGHEGQGGLYRALFGSGGHKVLTKWLCSPLRLTSTRKGSPKRDRFSRVRALNAGALAGLSPPGFTGRAPERRHPGRAIPSFGRRQTVYPCRFSVLTLRDFDRWILFGPHCFFWDHFFYRRRNSLP
jgi:hypothetical protein